jgi:uncharacterized protein
MPINSRAAIDRFLASKRVAFIGLSSNPSDFSRRLFEEFVDRGYDVIPVNPKLNEVNGQPCYSNVENIAPAVDAALVITSADASEQVVRQCAAAGVKRVWLYRAAGRGSVSDGALKACGEFKIDVVAGECPFMFLSGSHFPHNVHGWVKKLTFTYPM